MTIGYQRAPEFPRDTYDGVYDGAGYGEEAQDGNSDQSVKDLVKSLSEETSRLVRDEIKLATLELKEKGKHAGIGLGMFGGAGVVALYGAGALVASVIMLIGLAIEPWLSALIVALVLFGVAAVLALKGKKQVKQAVPAAPEDTIENVKADIAVIKDRVHR